MRSNSLKTLLFSTALSAVAALGVAGSVVLLKDRQQQNEAADRQKNILAVAGVLPEGKLTPNELGEIFSNKIREVSVNSQTGELCAPNSTIENLTTFEQRANDGQPQSAVCLPIYQRVENDQVVRHILPIEGRGLWSRLYGFIALSKDAQHIESIKFYKHGETAGLGGEIENPRWTAKWEGRQPFNEQGQVDIQVIRGPAGSPESDPHHVDGLSGATLTGNGVTQLVQFWLSDAGFGPYLARAREAK